MNLSALELSDIAFFGRSLAEYERFFAIQAADLRGRRVLDCAAGPSSFTAEAAELGVETTAVDPLYNHNETALRMRANAACSRMFAQLRAKPGLVATRTFRSIDTAEADRRAAVERFLDDYYPGVAIGRYVCARLPELPFADRSFDLVLCGHLLFLYVEQFDLNAHIDACLELCRVARGEVRIHPVVDLSGRTSPLLELVRFGLSCREIDSELIDVDYEFCRGATKTLILRPAAA